MAKMNEVEILYRKSEKIKIKSGRMKKIKIREKWIFLWNDEMSRD